MGLPPFMRWAYIKQRDIFNIKDFHEVVNNQAGDIFTLGTFMMWAIAYITLFINKYLKEK